MSNKARREESLGDDMQASRMCGSTNAERARKVTGVLVTDKHHGRAGTTFTVTRVHLSNDIASHVVSMDQRNGRFASGASAARELLLGPVGGQASVKGLYLPCV